MNIVDSVRLLTWSPKREAPLDRPSFFCLVSLDDIVADVFEVAHGRLAINLLAMSDTQDENQHHAFIDFVDGTVITHPDAA